jgi:hypothetical protein
VENGIYSANAERSWRTMRASLKLRDGPTNIPRSRENPQVEFKRNFSISSLAKYSRTIAASANKEATPYSGQFSESRSAISSRSGYKAGILAPLDSLPDEFGSARHDFSFLFAWPYARKPG